MYMYEYIKQEAHHEALEMAEDMAKDMAKNMAKNMAEDIAKDMAKDAAERMLLLVNAMLSGGDVDKISLLKDDQNLLSEMFKKYNL